MQNVYFSELPFINMIQCWSEPPLQRELNKSRQILVFQSNLVMIKPLFERASEPGIQFEYIRCTGTM